MATAAKVFGAIRAAGLFGYQVAEAIGIHEAEFSRRLNGRGGKFTREQRQQIAELVNLPEDELFRERAAAPVSTLLKECEQALNFGDPCFVLERISNQEPRESYLACAKYLIDRLRERQELKPEEHKHFTGHWNPQFNGMHFDTDGPKRAGETTLQSEGSSTIHPIGGMNGVGGGVGYSPNRETR